MKKMSWMVAPGISRAGQRHACFSLSQSAAFNLAVKTIFSIFALALPEFGKAFVSDTFSLGGVSQAEKGGFKASVNLGNLARVLHGSSNVKTGADPFSVLTAATGGTQLHFRGPKELEDAIAAIGVELRSAYLLSYSPNSTEAGYHAINVKVDIPGAKAYARPGYWMSEN